MSTTQEMVNIKLKELSDNLREKIKLRDGYKKTTGRENCTVIKDTKKDEE